MKLAISDIAFDDFKDAVPYLYDSGIEYIEVVPTKNKPFSTLTVDDLLNYKKLLNSYGFSPYSFLSLFYTLDVKSIDETEIIINHFKRLANYLNVIDGDLMVFGSPTFRKKTPTWESSVDTIFSSIDKTLKDLGKYIIIEPVSSYYGSEFFTTVDEICEYLSKKNYSNIFTMIDTHNSMLEKRNPIEEFNRCKSFIKHIHVAEPGLIGLKKRTLYNKFSEAIRGFEYVVTHELRAKEDFKKSIKLFGNIYG